MNSSPPRVFGVDVAIDHLGAATRSGGGVRNQRKGDHAPDGRLPAWPTGPPQRAAQTPGRDHDRAKPRNTKEKQMTQTPSADDVLMGSGRPAAKFDQPGAVVGGKIVTPPKTHVEREYNPTKPGQGEPKKFPSGDPIYGVTVDVQTSQRNDADDDGVRRIWIEGKRMKESVRDAVREAGAHRLEAGGELWVKFTGFGEAEGGLNPPKLWAAKYSAPTGPASQDEAWGPPATSQAPTAPPPQAPAASPEQPPLPAPPRYDPPAASPWGDEPPF